MILRSVDHGVESHPHHLTCDEERTLKLAFDDHTIQRVFGDLLCDELYGGDRSAVEVESLSQAGMIDLAPGMLIRDYEHGLYVILRLTEGRFRVRLRRMPAALLSGRCPSWKQIVIGQIALWRLVNKVNRKIRRGELRE